MILKNKKGDKIISVYWFFVLFIVTAAIVYMVLSFYGEPFDVREVEADILTNKVARCLSHAGYLESNVLTGNFRENFLEECGFNFKTENVYGWGAMGQYYVEINFSDFLTKKQNSPAIKKGNEELKIFCGQKGKTMPVCIKRSFYVLDKNQGKKQYQIDILSIVRKTEKNVQ